MVFFKKWKRRKKRQKRKEKLKGVQSIKWLSYLIKETNLNCSSPQRKIMVHATLLGFFKFSTCTLDPSFKSCINGLATKQYRFNWSLYVIQVGSFVWSHLTNLMESSDPSNKYVQQLLDDAEFEEKFDLDKMKFSRNYEGSFYLEKYNTGAMVRTVVKKVFLN